MSDVGTREGNRDWRRSVEEHRKKIESLADSDNPAAWVAEAVLDAADSGEVP